MKTIKYYENEKELIENLLNIERDYNREIEYEEGIYDNEIEYQDWLIPIQEFVYQLGDEPKGICTHIWKNIEYKDVDDGEVIYELFDDYAGSFYRVDNYFELVERVDGWIEE